AGDTQDGLDREAGRIWNPKNLPMDADGKPIAVWLYKLHGLSKEFVCEICGNHVYPGRLNFEKHFFEMRHTRGLKCLQIPNSLHFFGVTGIEEARALWANLKKASAANLFDPAEDEECEDPNGNIVSPAELARRMAMQQNAAPVANPVSEFQYQFQGE
ncbi:splicing factor 3A subunit 3, partial [Kipferlia bialata]